MNDVNPLKLVLNSYNLYEVNEQVESYNFFMYSKNLKGYFVIVMH